MNELIERLEAAGWKDQRPLLREAFDIIRPEPRKWDGFPWINPRKEWVNWYKDWRWFEAALRIGAYESAALTLVPEGWDWGGHSDCEFYVFKRRPDMRGGYARIIDATAATPALAICIAALKAHSTGMEGKNDD